MDDNKYMCHIASFIGVSGDEWDDAMQFSGLFNTRGQIISRNWAKLLKLAVTFRKCESIGEDGDRVQSLRVRFPGSLDLVLVADNVVPNSLKAQAFYDDSLRK